MARRGYIPTREEFAAAIKDLSERRYHGLYAPGVRAFDDYRPPGWATSARLVVALWPVGERRTWADTVRLQAGLEVMKPAEKAVKVPPKKEEQPYERVDDNRYNDGLTVCRVRTVGQRTYYMVR
jgi:hypothetical protein